MPTAPSLRSLALADVTAEDVQWMIREGETLVGLKSTIPSEGLGPTVASLANTLGGWVIRGVGDKTRDECASRACAATASPAASRVHSASTTVTSGAHAP